MAATMKQWKVAGKGGFGDLKYEENVPVPEVGDKDVLVKRKTNDHMPMDAVNKQMSSSCRIFEL